MSKTLAARLAAASLVFGLSGTAVGCWAGALIKISPESMHFVELPWKFDPHGVGCSTRLGLLSA
jgi:hypothetical protein